MKIIENIAVFCGSATGNKEIYTEKTRALGKLIVENNFTLIYGAGNIGLMGILADTILQKNGKVIGVIPQRLVEVEVVHKNLTETYIVQTMSERKMMFEKLADAYLILPGGYGTMDEFFEVLTLNQLGISKKPIGIFNIDGYFNKMFELFDHFVEERFIRAEHKELFFVCDDEHALIERLKTFIPKETNKWLEDFKHNKF